MLADERNLAGSLSQFDPWLFEPGTEVSCKEGGFFAEKFLANGEFSPLWTHKEFDYVISRRPYNVSFQSLDR